MLVCLMDWQHLTSSRESACVNFQFSSNPESSSPASPLLLHSSYCTDGETRTLYTETCKQFSSRLHLKLGPRWHRLHPLGQNNTTLHSANTTGSCNHLSCPCLDPALWSSPPLHFLPTLPRTSSNEKSNILEATGLGQNNLKTTSLSPFLKAETGTTLRCVHSRGETSSAAIHSS